MVRIDSSDVVRLVLQFLKENNLHESFSTLAKETGVCLNVIADKAGFLNKVKSNEWALVLEELQTSMAVLSREQLLPLYTCIFLDLVQREEFEAARVVLREGKVIPRESDRFVEFETVLIDRQLAAAHLQQLAASKAEALAFFEATLREAPKNRLLAIISDALQWQQRSDAHLADTVSYDLFLGKLLEGTGGSDAVAMQRYLHIPRAFTAVCFHASGRFMFAGDGDGFVHIVDHTTGSVPVEYEVADSMALPSQVSSLTFQHPFLIAGDVDGNVAVWRVDAEKVRPCGLFEQAVGGAVSSCGLFGSNVVCTGGNALLVLGLKSASVLRHIPGIKRALVTDEFIVCAKSDSLVLVSKSDYSSTELRHSQPITALAYSSSLGVLVDGHVFDLQRSVFTPYREASAACASHVSVSPFGNVIYEARGDSILAFKRDTQPPACAFHLQRQEPFGKVLSFAANPKFNILAVCSEDGLHLARP